MKKKTPAGREAFEAYYAALYGSRWPSLKEALLQEPVYEELRAGLLKSYFLDGASTLPVKALDVHSGMRVLDLCAAPGGKSLLLALAAGTEGSLTANDRSSARRARLKRVLQEHLPAELRERVFVTGHDAARWCLYETDAYDRVLLDAPCSSEGHVIRAPEALKIWSPKRPHHLARQAFSMIASALRVTRPGGLLVYATCSLVPEENDGPVERLVQRYGAMAEVLPAEAPWGEATPFGRIILPDTAGGRGPIYFAVIRRKYDPGCSDSPL
ncbi:MAG: RsmB/NOP family class I SAM-dependent RNA methyltransferase [Spirochaetales bacterium]|nr:RsmB/NOP family class I SAM-dependent RNA methyltransferase [Spirochaetales bacterium]